MKKFLLLATLSVSLFAANAQKVQWTASTDQEKWIQKKAPTFTDSKTTADITIETDTKMQQINGFGGCFNEIGWEALQALAPSEREKILKELFTAEGANFSYCRIPMGANDYSLSYYSCNDVAEDFEMTNFNIDRDRYILIPYVKEAMKYRPDLQIWASPWSPPAWMKVNNHYALRRGNLKGSHNSLTKDKEVLNNATAFRMENAYLSAYALYMSKFAQAYLKEGIHLKAIHVQNEIVYSPHWSSCTWRPEDLALYVGNYLGPQFKKDSIPTEIWLGTVNTSDPNYVRTFLKNQAAASVIKGIGFQWDAKYALPELSKEIAEHSTMQTESECGNGEKNWKSAEYTWSLINHYLNNGMNYYMYWNMVLDNSGKSTWDWVQNMLISVNKSTKEVQYLPEFYLMKHLSHFVQPGAFRLKTSGGKDHLAFVNPDGTTVLILVNTADTDRKFTISASGKTVELLVKAKSFNSLTWK